MRMPLTCLRLWKSVGRVCQYSAYRDVTRKLHLVGTSSRSKGLRRMTALSANGHLQCGLLVMDFDDTLTAGDTISFIFDAAAAAAEADFGASGKEEIRRICKLLAENYEKAFNSFMERQMAEGEVASSKRTWLRHFAGQLYDFEGRMVTVVEESRVLEGITWEALRQAGLQIPFQAGCKRVLERAIEQGIPVHVLSVNWSRLMIGTALRKLLLGDEKDVPIGEAVAYLPIEVHANDLEIEPCVGKTNGKIRLDFAGYIDKVAEFQRLERAEGRKAGYRVYCGDSLSDLGALLAADVGIVLGNSRSLRTVATAADISIVPLRDGVSGIGEGCRRLYSAGNWAEIEHFLFSSDASPVSLPTARVPSMLTIAGSDSGGGAGIQADLKTLSALGVFGTSAITALTAQNTRGVEGIYGIPAGFVRQQMDAVLDDIAVDVVKTGMLPSREVVEEVAEGLKRRQNLRLVVDPVLVATSGDSLATSDVGSAIVEWLFPLATIVTPNLPEASSLLGGRRVDDLQSMQEAARQLHALGPQFVLVKGGHLSSRDSSGISADKAEGEDSVTDMLFDGERMEVLSGPRIRTSNTHGTGCTTASAIAGYMARGMTVPAAVRAARGYITQALEKSAHLSIGSGPQRPFNHSFAVDDWRDLRRNLRSGGGLDLRLYAVTDPGCNKARGRTNADAVQAAVKGGVTFLQLREKDAEGGHFCAEAAAVIAVAREHRVQVVINDRVDVALATGADGVHVGQDDIPAALARSLLGPQKILGVSVKTVEQARQAQDDGADYLGAGAVFPTTTKDSSTISLDTLAEICRAVKIPVVAIGGITADNAPAVMEAGCAGVAVVSAIFGNEDPAAAAQALRISIS